MTQYKGFNYRPFDPGVSPPLPDMYTYKNKETCLSSGPRVALFWAQPDQLVKPTFFVLVLPHSNLGGIEKPKIVLCEMALRRLASRAEQFSAGKICEPFVKKLF